MNEPKWTNWLIVPHDPLIFRDGKPFTATPGARAASLPFPFPSTIAGAVRTLSGALANGGVFPAGDEEAIQQVLGYRVVGPFLFDLKQKELLFPAPQDALLLKLNPHDEHRANRVPLQPTERFQDVLTNLPEGLHLVAPIVDSKAKPHPHAPTFWRWAKVKEWLEHPQHDNVCLEHDNVCLEKLGIEALPVDHRTHVSIQGESGTAEDRALFHTAALTFVHASQPNALSDAAELGLLVQTDASLRPGIGALGGERRLASWEQADTNWLPSCPGAVSESIRTTRRGRLILATPAYFEQSFQPAWVCEHPSGVKLRIIGAAVGRPVHISGWDYEKHAPKPTRRLAPAGSVYFFEIEEGDDAAVECFIDDIWLSPISDDEQDRRDGFGVALLGAWNEEEV